MTVPADITDPRIAKAYAHPLRIHILGLLDDRTASPSEIAGELNAPLTHVSYHVRQLAGLGLIELVKTTPRRGAIEHEYRAAQPQSPMSDEAWERLPRSVREAMTAAVLDEVAHDVAAAAAAGGFDRDDAQVSRLSLDLDERGWSELTRELAGLLERARAIEAQSDARAGEGGDRVADGARRAALILMLFEHAAERAADAPRGGVGRG